MATGKRMIQIDSRIESTINLHQGGVDYIYYVVSASVPHIWGERLWRSYLLHQQRSANVLGQRDWTLLPRMLPLWNAFRA